MIAWLASSFPPSPWSPWSQRPPKESGGRTSVGNPQEGVGKVSLLSHQCVRKKPQATTASYIVPISGEVKLHLRRQGAGQKRSMVQTAGFWDLGVIPDLPNPHPHPSVLSRSAPVSSPKALLSSSFTLPLELLQHDSSLPQHLFLFQAGLPWHQPNVSNDSLLPPKQTPNSLRWQIGSLTVWPLLPLVFPCNSSFLTPCSLPVLRHTRCFQAVMLSLSSSPSHQLIS